MSHGGSAPEIDGDSVIMAESEKYSVWAETGYRAQASGESYPLGTVVLLVREKKASSYIAESAARGWPAVAQADRKDLIDYLTGQSETCQAVETAEVAVEHAPVQEPPAPSAAPWLEEGYPLFSRSALNMIPGCDFSFAIDIYDRAMAREKAKRKSASGEPSSERYHKRHRPVEHGRTDTKPREPYIIVVPNAMTSILTILNAPDFLQHGRFVPNAEKRAASVRKESSVIIQRSRGPDTGDDSNLKYKLVDNPTRLDDREWARVVAVFAHGPEWQFKAWKYSTPVDLFQRTLGIHLQFDDEQTKETIKAWNVHVLTISKTKRHLDQPVMFEFWRLLDDFLANKRPAQKHALSSSSAHRKKKSSHRRQHHEIRSSKRQFGAISK